MSTQCNENISIENTATNQIEENIFLTHTENLIRILIKYLIWLLCWFVVNYCSYYLMTLAKTTMGAVPTIIINIVTYFICKKAGQIWDKKYTLKKDKKIKPTKNIIIKTVAVVLALILFCMKISPITEYFGDIAEASKYGYANVYDDDTILFNRTSTSTVSNLIEEKNGEFASAAYVAYVSSVKATLPMLVCSPLGIYGVLVANVFTGTESAAYCYIDAIWGGCPDNEAISKSIFSSYQDNRPEYLR